MACVVIFLGVAGVMLLSRVQSAMAQQESGVGATEPELIDRAAQEEAGSPLLAGRFDEVIPDLLKQAAANPDDPAIQFQLGTVYLRAQRPAEGIPHARRACELDSQNLRHRWMLRVLTLMAGREETTIPEAYRATMPPAAPSPVKFQDVTQGAGVSTLALGQGSAWGDFDGDGREDLLDCAHRAPFRLFRNLGKGKFEDVAARVGLVDPVGLGCWAATFADYDNDGYEDIFLTGNGWGGFNRLFMFLFHNEKGRRFVDVTRQAGLGGRVNAFGAAWADYDNDGYLDVVVATGLIVPGGAPLLLYHNKGDGTFIETGSGTPLGERQNWLNVCWGDYDGDRLPDLGATSLTGGGKLFHNLGQGRFEEVAADSFIAYQLTGYTCDFLDYNNDGLLDHFISIYAPTGFEVTLNHIVGNTPAPPEELQLLYRNEGDGTFTDVTVEAGLLRRIHGMASQVGDVDHDGYTDILIGAGNPDLAWAEPQELYRNDGNGKFTPIARSAGINDWGKLHGMAFADYDDSGNLSLYASFGGYYWADRGYSRLFRNLGTGNYALEVRLVGTKSNRNGIGTRLVAHVGDRTIHQRQDGGSGFGSMNSRFVHIGVGKSRMVDLLEVHWPSGISQSFRQIPADQRIEVVEGNPTIRTFVRFERPPSAEPQPLSQPGTVQ